MLRGILFDFGGTLDSDGLCWPDRFCALYTQVGILKSREECLRAFYHSENTFPGRFAIEGLDLERTVELQVRCALEKLVPGRPELLSPIIRGFVDPSRKQLRANRVLLERLLSRFKLGIVSNFYGNLQGILAAEGMADLFTVVADSGKLGVFKPNKEIFLYALKKMEITPSQALMVGDSCARDMRGAEALDMAHAWLVSRALCPPPCCVKGAQLMALRELETLLATEAPHG